MVPLKYRMATNATDDPVVTLEPLRVTCPLTRVQTLPELSVMDEAGGMTVPLADAAFETPVATFATLPDEPSPALPPRTRPGPHCRHSP